jgi:hypothetical protein
VAHQISRLVVIHILGLRLAKRQATRPVARRLLTAHGQNSHALGGSTCFRTPGNWAAVSLLHLSYPKR